MKQLIASLLAAALLAGCAQQGEQAEQAQAPVAPAAPAQQPQQQAQQAMTAAQILDALKQAGVPIRTSIVFTAETDPNSKLGRPGEYTSKAACADPRVPAGKIRDRERGSIEHGCTVEVFGDGAAAQARSAFIQKTLKEIGGLLGSEYHYLRGGVLLRVTGLLTPKQAKVYSKAFDRLSL